MPLTSGIFILVMILLVLVVLNLYHRLRDLERLTDWHNELLLRTARATIHDPVTLQAVLNSFPKFIRKRATTRNNPKGTYK